MNALRMAALLLACALARPAAAADEKPDTTGNAAFIAMVNRPVVLRVPGAERVHVRENLIYRRLPGDTLRADVYLARHARGAAPVVILVHGGVGPGLPLRPKDWGLYRSWGRAIAASGMTAVTFNHRLGFPEPAIEQAHADLDSLGAFVRANAARWDADPRRIALATFSAGGMLIAPWIRERPPGLACIVAMYPIIDLRISTHLQRHVKFEQLESYSPGPLLAASAATMAPMMVVRAGRDQIPDLLPGLDRFVEEALAANAPLTLINLPDAPHGFDNHRADPRVLAVLREVIDFLKTGLGEAPAK